MDKKKEKKSFNLKKKSIKETKRKSKIENKKSLNQMVNDIDIQKKKKKYRHCNDEAFEWNTHCYFFLLFNLF